VTRRIDPAAARRGSGLGTAARRTSGRWSAEVTGPVDLRLAVGAVAAWLAVAIALDRSAAVVFLVAVLAALTGVVAVMADGVITRRLAPLAVAAFCIALVLLPLAARLAQTRDGPLARLARQHVTATVDLVVTSDPRPLTGGHAALAPRSAIDANLLAARVAGRPVTADGRLIVFGPAEGWRDVLPGQRVRLDVQLGPATGGLLAAVATSRSAPERVGHPPWWQRAAAAVRTSLHAAAYGLPASPRGLLPGLVDGDTSDLDPVLADHFRTAGLTHLVAVSGTNCVIIVGATLLVLRRFRCGPVCCAVVAGVVLVAFVIVARPSPSVLRAAVMAGIALGALATGRPRAALPMLATAVLGLLLWQPFLATDAGFTMSVLATGALLVIAPGWAGALRMRRIPPVVAESVAVAAAAHLVTAPVVAAISGRVSLVAIPANVLAEPVVAAATITGFGAALTAPVVLPVAELLAQLAGWPCRWLVWVATWFGSLPGATLPWPSGLVGGLALLTAIGAVAWVARRTRRRAALGAVAVGALIVQIPLRSVTSGWPAAGEVFVACDIGQGDALLLPAGPGAAVVIDTGPDPVVVDRCLREQHVTDVPLLVLTHDHVDHVGGLSGVLHGRRVGRVITGPLAEPESGARMVAVALGLRGLRAEPGVVGTSLRAGDVTIDVLGPARAFRGTRSDPNNSSLVLRAEMRGVRILLPGDAEVEAQDALLNAGVDLRADVLKVPHHGSAYSDSAFLAAVHARVAVISVGAGNDYGHPAPSLLATMHRLGLPILRTDQDGEVAVTESAGRLATSVRPPNGIPRSAPGGASDRQALLSPPPVTMGAWPLTVGATFLRMVAPPTQLGPPSPSRLRLAPPSPFRRWSWSWVTRSSSLPERSSRSPPRPAGSIRTRTSTSAPALRWRRPNCSSCSAPRCSEVGGSW
jgi:competence protein ComEC